MSGNILAVDDSKTLRASVKFTLKKAGYDVYLADNGKTGIEKLKELTADGDRPELIITDINMPEMDGITFLKNVKEDKIFRYIPVIILTTESQEEMIMKGKKLGAAGWLVKPFKPEQLKSVAKKFVRG
ncbi:MAG: response regulator [Halothermotrichaceae bacterium]